MSSAERGTISLRRRALMTATSKSEQYKAPINQFGRIWLPSPPSLPFNLSVRVYQPKTALKDGTFKIPPVRRVRDS